MIDQSDDGIPKYPMLKLIVRHGGPASIGLALIVLCMALAIAVTLKSIAIGVVGTAVAVLAYILTRILVELVRLITDMLLPQ